ncbi:hypothetical protein [Idiomarina abyssalis]|uniref:Uncharacterized protein n=1 Tax=Idiomarina abyssalis TaxID=86102 RepID=A0A8I1GF63_9GAMM|nr:hypothetical protein [Idiomarina abyssalis]MBJ7266361.1 hypothetical protein [Idiomarina abyssalis]MBJ7316918.1 hypothetical protein [Idiomarina abyssalis]
MNKITEYMGYLGSLVFGGTLVAVLITDISNESHKWGLVIALLTIWLGPLMRIGFLSGKLKEVKAEE